MYHLLCEIDYSYANKESLTFHQPDFLEDMGVGFVDIYLVVAREPILPFLLITLPLAYGGIHLAAWNFQFASNIEHLFWKIACIIIMTTFIVITMTYLCILLLDDLIRKRLLPSIERILDFLMEKSIFVLLLFYSLSRIYLLIESFISLRHAPIGVFVTVPWVQSIPHI